MRKIWLGLLIGVAVACGVLASCANTNQVTPHEVGLASKASAESTYQAIYTGYRRGEVSERDMDKARSYYQRWSQAQMQYVRAAQSGQLSDATTAPLVTALNDLLGLASAYGLL